MNRIAPSFCFCAILILALLFAQQASASPHTLGQNEPQSPTIIGGEEAEPGAWPAMAALMYSNAPDSFAQFCGGTLITPEWVLTAAHCMFDEDDNILEADAITVTLGRHALSSDEGKRIRATELILHPDYDQDTDINDIGLIKLSEPWDGPIMPISRPSVAEASEEEGKLATVIGWGQRDVIFEDYPDTLHQVSVPLVTNTTCSTGLRLNAGYEYADGLAASMLCAGFTEGGKDACVGDSGGPLMVKNIGGATWVQVGIVSWGFGCANPGLHGVYTRVSDYFDWVKTQTGGIDPLPEPTAVSLHQPQTISPPLPIATILLFLLMITSLAAWTRYE